MATHEIVICVLVAVCFLGTGAIWLVQRHRWRWPGERRVKRRTSQGVEVTTIDAPGDSPYQRAKVGEACARAVEITFDMYDAYKDVDSWREIEQVAVRFISDDEMDQIQKVLWPQYKSVSAYLSQVRRFAGDEAMPLAIVRESLGPLVVKKGAPVIHEMMHALRGEFSGERLDRAHDHDVWKTLVPAAENYFASSRSN